ncbi:MAG: ribose ABC transporter [Alphaproteobacteria bacterium]|nr:ribose ABC transporter [Alphaproteobacteria bacterium]
MLKGIPALIGPDLLHVLGSMGHGDELVVADANFPGASLGPRLIRMDGHSATEVLDAVLTLMPLDDFEHSAFRMEVVGEPDRIEPVMTAFASIVTRHEPLVALMALERHAFYARARHAFAIVQTGETRLYGNVIIKKGVVGPGD